VSTIPWQTPLLIELIEQAKTQIYDLFDLSVNTPVYIATESEMIEAVIKEQKAKNRGNKELEKIKYDLLFILGKYFTATKEIWVVEGRGEALDVIFHEILHPIQKCNLHKEKIIDYITYKITGNKDYFYNTILKDWQEIEKSNGFDRIKTRLIKEGDCEDF